MKVSDKGGNFEQVAPGTYTARCVRLIDIGTQTSEYQGKANSRRQVVIAWELPDALMEDGDSAGKPFLVSSFYTASLGEKANLRHDLVSWRGREFSEEELSGFDLVNILGKPCMLSIVQNEKGKSIIKGVMALPKGSAVGAQINTSLYFSLDEFNPTIFETLPKFYKERIAASPEYGRVLAKAKELEREHDRNMECEARNNQGARDEDDFNDPLPF